MRELCGHSKVRWSGGGCGAVVVVAAAAPVMVVVAAAVGAWEGRWGGEGSGDAAAAEKRLGVEAPAHELLEH